MTVCAFDRDGNPFTLEAEGMLARCICHESDHLDGVTIMETVSYTHLALFVVCAGSLQLLQHAYHLLIGRQKGGSKGVFQLALIFLCLFRCKAERVDAAVHGAQHSLSLIHI